MRKKTFVKTWLALMLSVLSLMCAVKSNLAAAETATTVKGVDVSISVESREKPYELGEKVPVTVTLKNTNDYQITLGDLKLTSDDCQITSTSSIPETLGAGEEATVRADAFLATYEATKTVQIEGQDIDVHILAAKNTVPAGSAFMVTTNVDADKHKKNIDNPGNYEAAAIFNFSLEKDGQPQQFKNGGVAEVRIKIPAGWDAHELQMAFISGGTDEQFVELVENGYLVFRTNHFSPYAMLDPVDEKKPATSDSSVKTGDLALATMVTFGVTAILALLTAIAFRKKIYRKTLAILFALSLALPMISAPTADAETDTGTVTAEFAFSDLGPLKQNSDGTVVRTTVQKTAAITATLEVLGAAGGTVPEQPTVSTAAAITASGVRAHNATNQQDNVTFTLGAELKTNRTDNITVILKVSDDAGNSAETTAHTFTYDPAAADAAGFVTYSVSDLEATITGSLNSLLADYTVELIEGPTTLKTEGVTAKDLYTGADTSEVKVTFTEGDDSRDDPGPDDDTYQVSGSFTFSTCRHDTFTAVLTATSNGGGKDSLIGNDGTFAIDCTPSGSPVTGYYTISVLLDADVPTVSDSGIDESAGATVTLIDSDGNIIFTDNNVSITA